MLLNELLCAYLAQSLGLNIPEFGLCLLEENLAKKHLADENAGVCFYSTLVEKVYTLTNSGFMKDFINGASDFYKLVLFDHIIYNKDRNRGNLLISGKDKRIYIIDHSHVFKNQTIWDTQTFKIGMKENDYTDLIILEYNDGVYRLFTDNVPVDLAGLLFVGEEFKKILTSENIRSIFNKIPTNLQCGEKDYASLFSYLEYRISHIDDYCKIIYEYYK